MNRNITVLSLRSTLPNFLDILNFALIKELVCIIMKLYILQDLKNCGKLPPITFNTNPIIGKKPDKNYYFLKVNINTHPGEAKRKIV